MIGSSLRKGNAGVGGQGDTILIPGEGNRLAARRPRNEYGVPVPRAPHSTSRGFHAPQRNQMALTVLATTVEAAIAIQTPRTPITSESR